jgi:dipeptidyl aminopeptidase/acylaminoacyl peptidase
MKRPLRFFSPNTYWRRLTGFTIAVSGLAVVFLLACLVHKHVVVFTSPHRNTRVELPDNQNISAADITLTTVDGLEIAGWHIAGTQSKAIIVVHGIDTNRTAVLPEAESLAQAGYHILLIDLRGHGLSEGNQNSYGYREALDVVAAVEYAASLPGVDHIGAVGTSLGGAAVARAATLDSRLEAVVITSSFSSLPEAVTDAFDNMALLPTWPFAPLIVFLAERRVGVDIAQVNSARDLATLSPRAVMIIHGTADDLFPVYHAQKMFESAGQPKTLWLIEGLGHENPAVGREAEYQTRVTSFFEQAFTHH